jgi:hypothetical protein
MESPPLRFVCLWERRSGEERTRGASARTPMRNLKRKLGRRSGIRFSAPGPPAGRLLRLQFNSTIVWLWLWVFWLACRCNPDPCCSPSSPHIAIVLGNATAFYNCLHSLSTSLSLSSPRPLIRSIGLYTMLSLSLITHRLIVVQDQDCC